MSRLFAFRLFSRPVPHFIATAILATGCSTSPQQPYGVYKIPGLANQPTVVKSAQVTGETTGDQLQLTAADMNNTPRIIQQCIARSGLRQPYTVGQVIQTPAYALVTLGEHDNQSRNTFCVINKRTVQAELTPVSDLTYSQLNTAPASP